MKMKNKILFLAALVSGIALVSCEQREFVPKTANNPVQFPAELDTIGMTSEYVYIPVQMTDQFTTAAKAVVEFVDGTKTYSGGREVELREFTDNYEEGGDILITSKEIYIPGFDPEDDDSTYIPTAYIEVRIPDYRSYEQFKLNFKLVGENPQGITEMTVVLTQFEGAVLEGTFAVANYFGTAYTFTVTRDASVTNRYWFTGLEGAGTTIPSLYGVLDIDGVTMTIPLDQTNQAADLAGTSFGSASGGNPDTGNAPVLVFSRDGITFSNGFFCGTPDGSQWKLQTLISAGSRALLQ